MENLIEYILQFGNLNKQQTDLIRNKVREVELKKDAYFSEAGKIPRQVGFILEGVVRGCYYNNKGEEITRCFITENNLVVDYVNFEANSASSEYLQASTDCKLLVFSKQDWEELSHTIVDWDSIKNKMVQKCLYQKSRRRKLYGPGQSSRKMYRRRNPSGLAPKYRVRPRENYLCRSQQLPNWFAAN